MVRTMVRTRVRTKVRTRVRTLVLAVVFVPALVFAQKPVAGGRAAVAKPSAPATFGIGRAATPEEIKALDIDVRPDGRGLPPGAGTVAEGAKIYAAKCASCHGKNGEGATFDRLVATEAGKNFDFATNAKLPRAVGNYWPYATTLYDYTYRAMPFMQPGTLTANGTYSLVAYILALNKIVPEDAVMDAKTLPAVKMPARDRFVIDNRTGGKVVK
jgi:mono/diheme cytochrome c family protein